MTGPKPRGRGGKSTARKVAEKLPVVGTILKGMDKAGGKPKAESDSTSRKPPRKKLYGGY